jgi:protoheme IX farnesyltransferase
LKADVESVAPLIPVLARTRGLDYLELTKPRITLLVLATTLVGFYLGSEGKLQVLPLLHALFGTGLVAAAASALNMWLERDLDSLMKRTVGRPLPAGRLQPGEALAFSLVIAAAGLVYLFLFANVLATALAAITLLSYLFVYTPLKTRTWLCTLIGAVPGAVPPMIGWAAANGELAYGAWILFAIVFFWQMPHFYAIAWMHREDYRRAGFPMLPIIDRDGKRTSRQVSLYLSALILVTLLPSAIGLAGSAYLIGALALGLIFLASGLYFARMRDRISALRLFIISVCYLPALMALLAIDKVSP